MVVLSFKENQIIFLSGILSTYETESRQYEVLEIFTKLKKSLTSRSLKKRIDMDINDFKKTNKVRDLKTYNSGVKKR